MEIVNFTHQHNSKKHKCKTFLVHLLMLIKLIKTNYYHLDYLNDVHFKCTKGDMKVFFIYYVK